MTREEILNMPAGREMDALIAVVVGWVIEDITAISPTGGKWARNVHGDDGWLPYYSTDISAAWEVVIRFCIPAPADCWTGPTMQINYEHGECEVIFDHLDSIDCVVDSIQVTAETAPLAICRAALLTTLED